MLEFLNANSGAINVVLAGVVATATVVYVLLTRILVIEARRSRQVQTEPQIAVYAEDSVSIHFKDFVLRNIGAGPAYQIRFEVLQDFEYEKGKLFSEFPFVKNGLNYLAPGQQFSFFLTSLLENRESKLATPLRVRVIYGNRSGAQYSEDFVLDFSQTKGVTFLERRDLESVAREIEKIRQQIERFGSGFNKLRILDMTESGHGSNSM